MGDCGACVQGYVSQEACQHYRAMVEHSPTMVWRAGLDAKREYFNATWLAFTGRALHQELGNGWAENVHPDDLDPYLALHLDHFERRQAFVVEYRLRRHDGVYRQVLDRCAPYLAADGAFAGIIGSCVDVEDRRVQAAVYCAVEFFEMSVDNLCVAGLDGYFKRLNPAWTKTLGWTSAELMSRPSIEFVHPDDRPALLEARQRLRAGMPLRAVVNRYQCKDGTYRWFEWSVLAHVDRGLVYGVARDVTEQRDAQRVLGELTESLSATLDSIADGVIATDANGAVARMNPVAERLTGWTFGEVKGKPLGQFFHIVQEDTRVTAALPVERTLRDGVAVAATNHTLLIGRDGTELPISSSCAPMRNGDGSVSGAVLVFRDMTAEKKGKEVQEQLQRQLILADRMASVGTLAAGVAHEINNPLAYMMANLDMLVDEISTIGTKSSPAQMGEWAAMANQARQGTERIRKIVSGLKTFCRSEQERRAATDVTQVLELSVNLAFNKIKHRARLVKDYGEIPLVEADDARLGQVFINLLVNAAQALPEGDSAAHEIRIVTSSDDRGRAVVEVRDTGPGIPVGVIGRVFDPFFTTKPVGVGTGLGLSICQNIVASMGGEITASSQEGCGAIFRVVLPPVSARLPAAPDEAAAENLAALRP